MMMGHDAVPHFIKDSHYLPEHSATLPYSSYDGLTDLQNSFSHFHHPAAESNLVYPNSAEKKLIFRKRSFIIYHFSS